MGEGVLDDESGKCPKVEEVINGYVQRFPLPLRGGMRNVQVNNSRTAEKNALSFLHLMQPGNQGSSVEIGCEVKNSWGVSDDNNTYVNGVLYYYLRTQSLCTLPVV